MTVEEALYICYYIIDTITTMIGYSFRKGGVIEISVIGNGEYVCLALGYFYIWSFEDVSTAIAKIYKARKYVLSSLQVVQSTV